MMQMKCERHKSFMLKSIKSQFRLHYGNAIHQQSSYSVLTTLAPNANEFVLLKVTLP